MARRTPPDGIHIYTNSDIAEAFNVSRACAVNWTQNTFSEKIAPYAIRKQHGTRHMTWFARPVLDILARELGIDYSLPGQKELFEECKK